MNEIFLHDALFGGFTPEEQAILESRAKTLAQDNHDTSSVQTHSLLTVVVGGEHYALYLDSLFAIHDSLSVTRVPCTPAFVRGVANVRGHLVTVLDLAALFNGTRSSLDEAANSGQLLLVEAGQEQVALLVDQTEGVESITPDQIQPLPLELDHLRNALGILLNGIVLIDVKALVNDPALIVNAEGLS
jgi:purine-binding chemotaxis protein CheW